MLTLTIEASEQFDEETEEFITNEAVTLDFEHSLVSLSKWESYWEVPYLSDKSKTTEQTYDYIRCMCLDENVELDTIKRMSNDNLQTIQEYISAKKTATWFTDHGKKKPGRKEIITSELVYYWMVTFRIPWESQYWHLNRLITLIEVCNRKNEKPKKMSKADAAARNRQLNAQRRAQLNSPG